MGDIGTYFPSDSDEWKGAPSHIFLTDANNKIKNEGFIINNIDSTIVLEKPRLAQNIPDIVQSLSKILDLDRSKICVKATTTDGLGFIGNELGWGVLAIVSISNQ